MKIWSVPKNKDALVQYVHGGISVIVDMLNVGLVYIVVDREERYCSSTNTLLVEFDVPKNDYTALYNQYDKDYFSSKILYSYIKCFY